MQSISLFLDIVKFADFQSKNVDDSKTQGVCHVIHVFLGKSSLGNKCAKSHHCRICVTDFRWDLFAPPPPPPLPRSMSCSEKAHPEWS